jgi:bifunctional pyridoxal-dependent enzyme with beta-cystathionase and maltose regulon repressor activities
LSTLLVGYDLNRPGQDYSELIKFLKSQQAWWHALDSTWIVVTPYTVSGLLDEIKRFIDANDDVLVVDVKGDWWASFGLSDEASNWLMENV